MSLISGRGRIGEWLLKKGGDGLPCMAKLLPIHILPPLPNAQNHFIISAVFSFPASNHLSGLHSSGLGKTSSFLCSEYACALTLIPPGRGGDPAIDVGVEGVMRG